MSEIYEPQPHAEAIVAQLKKRREELIDDALKRIRLERERQDAKWGVNAPTIDRMFVVLGEEFGEACNAHLERDFINLKTELIQVAAVCVKMLAIIQAGETVEIGREVA